MMGAISMLFHNCQGNNAKDNCGTVADAVEHAPEEQDDSMFIVSFDALRSNQNYTIIFLVNIFSEEYHRIWRNNLLEDSR